MQCVWMRFSLLRWRMVGRVGRLAHDCLVGSPVSVCSIVGRMFAIFLCHNPLTLTLTLTLTMTLTLTLTLTLPLLLAPIPILKPQPYRRDLQGGAADLSRARTVSYATHARGPVGLVGMGARARVRVGVRVGIRANFGVS